MPSTFDSILNQQSARVEYEIIVVIDGGGQGTREYVEKHKEKFIARGIKFKVVQFIQNRGRFSARIKGAQLAKNNQILFIDDRVQLAPDFFSELINLNEEVIIPNVIDSYLPGPQIISNSLFLLRRLIYKGKQGKFKEYYITTDNFESSPKGSTSLWVNRKQFLQACKLVGKYEEGKYLNEDTKVFKQIIDSGSNILRTSKLNIEYQPRTGFWRSFKHLYERGPRFVDYYMKPGTRFFPLLAAIYIAVCVLIATAVWKPVWLIYYLIVSIFLLLIASVPLTKNIKEYLTLISGLPMVVLAFTLGVIKGTFIKISGR